MYRCWWKRSILVHSMYWFSSMVREMSKITLKSNIEIMPRHTLQNTSLLILAKLICQSTNCSLWYALNLSHFFLVYPKKYIGTWPLWLCQVTFRNSLIYSSDVMTWLACHKTYKKLYTAFCENSDNKWTFI